jgi:hypothetical protein
MSQVGNILSTASTLWCGPDNSGQQAWMVQFSYQTDAGATAVSQVVVGNNLIQGPPPPPNPASLVPASALWTSPTSFITVSPNPPGVVTGGPIRIPCPPIVKMTAFGLPSV